MDEVINEPAHVEAPPAPVEHIAETAPEPVASESEPPSVSPFVGKTVKAITIQQHASVFVVDLEFTDNTHYFIKNKQGVVELGGTFDWGSGVQS